MSTSSLVSVIIPVYNGEKYLKETLESVIQQDYSPFEIIVVDDGSTDGSATIVESFQKVRYVFQENQGNARARTKGIELAQGAFIALLDQDDLWTENKLTVHINCLHTHPDVTVTTSYFKFFLTPGMSRPAWCREELLRGGNPSYSPSTFVARKSVFDVVGMFNSDFKTASDAEWISRAKDKQTPITIIPEVLAYRRLHNQNQSTQVMQAHLELLRLTRQSIKRKTGNEHGTL